MCGKRDRTNILVWMLGEWELDMTGESKNGR
jgi:hypothetical protein